MILVAQSISLLYQYWIHTELIERLGPLEWVFNTPSHHRVHHGSNHKYLDRNHGGILIIWDRIFGTFQQEQERPSYGLTINLESYNLFLIAFHEWRDISKDIVAAKTWRGRFLYAFGPPGWREDGIGRTASEMRRDASQYA
jgi:sterol desaturase/sphingolipid hydroxylase (fatty acid hydroxylase superfamily)